MACRAGNTACRPGSNWRARAALSALAPSIRVMCRGVGAVEGIEGSEGEEGVNGEPLKCAWRREQIPGGRAGPAAPLKRQILPGALRMAYRLASHVTHEPTHQSTHFPAKPAAPADRSVDEPVGGWEVDAGRPLAGQVGGVCGIIAA